MALEVKTAKNSKLLKLSENCFELVGKGGWSPISTWIKERNITKVQPSLIQKTVRVRENVGSMENLGISRRIVRKDNKHPKRNSQKNQIQLYVWLMKFC